MKLSHWVTLILFAMPLSLVQGLDYRTDQQLIAEAIKGGDFSHSGSNAIIEESVRVAQELVAKNPKGQTLFIALGRSPTSIAAALQSMGEPCINLPASTLRTWSGVMNRNPEARQEAKNHLNRFLPRELIAKYKNIVVVDFIKTAGSVRQGLNLIQEHIGSDGPTAKVAVLEIDQVSLDIEEGTFREHPVQRIKVKGELAQSIAYQRPEDYAEFPKYTIGTGSERSLNRQTQYADLMLRTGHYLSSEGIRSVPQEQLVSQWLETHVRSFEQFENAISTVKSSQIQGKKLTATIERNPYTDTEKVSIFIRNSDGTDTRITINDKLIEAQIRSGNQRALTYESAIKHLETELTLKKTILTQVLKDPAIIGTTIWEELIFKLAAYPKGAQFVHETLVLDRALKTNPFVKIIAPLVTPERPSFLSCLLKKYATR